jgi:DNA polymerase
MTGPHLVRAATDPERWFEQVLSLLSQHIAPEQILWDREAEAPVLPGVASDYDCALSVARGSRNLLPAYREAAALVLAHRDPGKWPLLYRVAWRLDRENPCLLKIESDADVHRLRRLQRQVEKDIYRMMQFVRFRQVGQELNMRYVAWHRPDHDVLAFAAPFFVKRFARLRWSIVTPTRSAHWDGTELRFAAGVPRAAGLEEDELEDLWRTYYGTVFDPARTNPRAMTSQMPRRFWSQLPEATEIVPLIHGAEGLVATMIQDAGRQAGARPFVPVAHSLEVLSQAAASCRGCELYAGCTQTVFGAGPAKARIVLVGEQPGDEEDRTGLPFVGPAGTVLERALHGAGLDRETLYITNAVKHFRFVPAGRTRKHQTPRGLHIEACRPWLEAELETLKPVAIVCLGATAAKSVLGRSIKVVQQRGRILPSRWGAPALVTFHPSACLRAPDPATAERLYRTLVTDLATVASLSATP